LHTLPRRTQVGAREPDRPHELQHFGFQSSVNVIDTWLFLRSGANLLMAILVHLLANYCGGILGAPAFPFFFGAQATAEIAIVAFGGLRPARAPSVAVGV
jgi:hypothetical protein